MKRPALCGIASSCRHTLLDRGQRVQSIAPIGTAHLACNSKQLSVAQHRHTRRALFRPRPALRALLASQASPFSVQLRGIGAMSLELQVLRTAKAAVDEGLLQPADYTVVKEAFMKALAIKGGVDSGFLGQADFAEARKEFFSSLGMAGMGGGAAAAPQSAPTAQQTPASTPRDAPAIASSQPAPQTTNGNSAAVTPPTRLPASASTRGPPELAIPEQQPSTAGATPTGTEVTTPKSTMGTPSGISDRGGGVAVVASKVRAANSSQFVALACTGVPSAPCALISIASSTQQAGAGSPSRIGGLGRRHQCTGIAMQGLTCCMLQCARALLESNVLERGSEHASGWHTPCRGRWQASPSMPTLSTLCGSCASRRLCAPRSCHACRRGTASRMYAAPRVLRSLCPD